MGRLAGTDRRRRPRTAHAGPYTAGLGPQRLFDPTLLDATLHTGYGQLHSARLLLLGLLGLLFAMSLRVDARPAPWEGIAGLLTIGVAATFSASGHAGTTDPTSLSIVVDMLHLARHVGLDRCAGHARRRGDPASRTRRAAPGGPRGVDGRVHQRRRACAVRVVLGLARCGHARCRLHHEVRLLVVAKVVLFVGILGVANLSRIMVRRRLVRPQLAYANTDVLEPEDDEELEDALDVDDDPVATERLRRAVFVEVMIALVVLALTAVLVVVPARQGGPRRAVPAAPVRVHEPGRGRTLTITSDPGTHGNVNLTVDVSAGPRPTSITATATQTDKLIGPVPVKLSRAGDLTWDGSGALTVAGPWRLDVVVTTSEFDATTADVTLDLH